MQKKVFSWNKIIFCFHVFCKNTLKIWFWALSECVKNTREADMAAKSPFWAFSKSIKHQKSVALEHFWENYIFYKPLKNTKNNVSNIFFDLCLPTELFSETKTSLKGTLRFCFAYGKICLFWGKSWLSTRSIGGNFLIIKLWKQLFVNFIIEASN